jgi:pimeloyl-ACP methyl ester carboxylesterase
MTIVYIHGGGATCESFTHIREYVRDHTELPDVCLEYQSTHGFEQNLDHMKGQLDHAEQLFFVSHSLGGIYALYLADHYGTTTRGGVSLSTPYGGCREADFARYFLPFNRLMQDIGAIAGPLYESRHVPAPPNWTQVVTTVGQSPWIQDANDGVVTLKSMRFRQDFELIDLPLNHYEVVISNQSVQIILDKIQQVM